jgi:hypothetical protein
MKKQLLVIVLISIVCHSFGADYIPCRLIFKNGTTKNGYVKIPDMLDKDIKFRDNIKSTTIEFPSDNLSEIIFTQENQEISYQRVLTYANYGNKNVNNRDSWLKVLKTGYMKLYFGFQTGFNSPSYKLWYCKKTDDSIAYFISMKYSGGFVITVGTENNFKENASFYFGDYKELADKIVNSEYKFEDLEQIVDLYNTWYESK